jgi:hypothetical protein
MKLADQQKIVKKIRDAGIKITRLKESPIDFDVFLLRKEEVGKNGRLEVFFGDNAEVKVYPNKSKKQAVLDIHEPERLIEEEVSFSVWRQYGNDLEGQAKSAFTVAVPEDTTFTVEDIKKNESDQSPHSDYIYYTAKVIAEIPESRQYILCGIDESYHFVSLLPEPAKSVTQAHEILRPEGVDKNAYRQGEWFFQPVDQAMSDKLDNMIYDIRVDQPLSQDPYDETHYAKTAIRLGGRLYAIGFIFDERGAHHHSSLWLPEWCEVIRNTELEVEDVEYYD